MYYYRNKRKKSNKGLHQQTFIVPPLNDVWESFQEPKSYKDFGISEEAFLFLSNREKCKQIRERNSYWSNKKKRIDRCKETSLIIAGILFVITVFLFSQGLETIGIASALLLGISIVFSLLLLIPNSIIKRKIVDSFDNIEGKFNSYNEYLERYNAKKAQYLSHIQELDEFKNNEAPFLDGIADRLKRVQGRTYRTEDEWRQMSDRDFEFEIGKVYSRLGYQTIVTKRSGDGGVDVIATKDNETVYIQCKHYGENTHLGAPELQAFWGCCSGNGINKGVMVCTSSLTKDAQAFANKLKGNLEIIGMKELIVLDKTYYQSHPINSQRQFTDAFKNFLSSNNFVDCDHLWIKFKVYYKEEDAKKDLEALTKWKNHNYLIKDTIVSLTNKIRVYVILLVPDYALEEVKNTHL